MTSRFDTVVPGTPTQPPSLPPAEQEERAHLSGVVARLRRALAALDARVRRYAQDIQEQKVYLWESKADMDHVEKVFTRQVIEQTTMTGETVRDQRTRVARLLHSPYFGRFDFARDGDADAEAIYVGVHHFTDDHDQRTLVHDWRAPVATLFYDYELGPAGYRAPAGDVTGEIRLKRQFRIRDGHMEFLLESSMHIVDDLLQEELSRASDDGMRNIVATIQRDQNAIIRDEHTHVLVIQGVAGSGKTSIALHRIAFLLYRFKESLTSRDILIISPNRVFADYISNVLPELGEESVEEIGMETLADELLDGKVRFQTFIEQTAALLDSEDADARRRIEVKASRAFLQTLDDYADHVERMSFIAEDVWLGRCLVPAWFIHETFRKHRGVGLGARIATVVSAAEQKVGIHYNHDLSTAERGELRAAIRRMCRQSSLRNTYKGLFDWMEQPELFTVASRGRLEYADVFPLIYLKLRLEGVTTERRAVKHLLIDEMQDYTPVQYAVIGRLFPCRKTILGDANQSVNPYSASGVADIVGVFAHARAVKLCRSYRSTWEITRFAQQIVSDPDVVPIERHGEAPRVERCASTSAELSAIATQVEAFSGRGHRTLGIICKTQRQASRLQEALHRDGHDVCLLDGQSRSFGSGITVCTAHMAKGLEFDEVVVPQVTDRNYGTPMDRHLLYVACTRAMHRLTLTYVGTPSPIIPGQQPGTGLA